MRSNRGFTIIELIIVTTCLSMVILFFWILLDSSSKDSYTINDKIVVQSSVTSLMNVIEQDVKEAKIFNFEEGTHIIAIDEINDIYNFSGVEYSFDENLYTVTRTNGSSVNTYNNIVTFYMKGIKSEKYGVEVKIIGGNTGDEVDKSRYELNSTFYTRNTL